MLSHLANHDRQALQTIMFSLYCGNIDIDMILERFGELDGVDVAALKIEVHVDKVKAAACAAARKAVEVRKTCRTTTVSDSWSSERCFTDEGLHIFLVNCDAVTDFKIGLASVVRLVGAASSLIRYPNVIMKPRRSTYPKRVVVPLWIKSGMVVFQFALLRLLSTAIVGT